MTAVRFFRATLVLPILTPLLLVPFGLNWFLGLLFISLAFGGLQYIVFATIVFFWIGRLKEAQKIRRLSYWAPLLLISFQAAGWVAWCYMERLSNPELVGCWGALVLFAVYVLFIGYAYVVLVNLVYVVLYKRLISNEAEHGPRFLFVAVYKPWSVPYYSFNRKD